MGGARPIRMFAMGIAALIALSGCTAAGSPSTGAGAPGTAGTTATQPTAGGTPTVATATPLSSDAQAATAATPTPTAASTPAPSGSKPAATKSPALRATGAVRPIYPPLPPPPPPPNGYQNLILYSTNISGSSNRQFWLIKDDGTGKRTLAQGRAAHWNKNGSGIEVVSVGSNCVPSMSVYPAGGGSATPVSIAFQAGDGSFDWTPDGAWLSFWRYPKAFNCGGANAFLGRNLQAVKSDGTGMTTVASLAGVEAMSWVPDGSAIVVINLPTMGNSGPIQRIDVATKAVKQILAAGTYASVDVSRDGKYLAYIKYAGSQWRLHVTDNVGTSAANVRHHDWDMGQAATQDRSATWGSDHQHIVVIREWTDLGHTYDECIWADPTGALVANWTCGNFMTYATDGTASWSPDNLLIANIELSNFGSGDPPINKIWVVATDQKGGIGLAGTENATWLSWQPFP